MTTHTFSFDRLDTAFDIMEKKKDGVINNKQKNDIQQCDFQGCKPWTT